MKGKNLIIALVAGVFMAIGILHSQPDNGAGETPISETAESTGINIGDKAPEIDFLTGVDRDTIKLSSLKGKLVLIDFWASWCRPCRMENPNVVAAYKEYKDKKFKNGKGFEVYSVSLDEDKNRWIAAIEQDKLDWDAHVSDLRGWRCRAGRKYHVMSIPSSFLIDGDGIIIAKNLRGASLHSKLQELEK